MYPDIINKTINSLKKFNGIGEKTAERLTLSLLDISDEDVNEISDSILNLKRNIKICNCCGNITENDLCYICLDKSRDKNLICVVEDYKSLIMFEKSGNYNGVYHVLNGLISPIDGKTPDELNIDSLLKRIDDKEKVEIIIALKPSIEGETTTLYLKKILENKNNVSVSRLSYGIPLGVEIDYLDSLTLDRALKDRKII